MSGQDIIWRHSHRARKGWQLLRITSAVAALLFTRTDSTANINSTAVNSAIRVGQNTHVSAAQAERTHVEVLATVHPLRPELLLACAMVEAAPPSPKGSATIAYRSADAGETWSPVLEVPGGEFGAGDPACAFTARERAYMVSGAIGNQSTLVHSSEDDGRTWRQTAALPITDRPYLLSDDGAGSRVYLHGRGHRNESDAEPRRAGVAVYTSAPDSASFVGSTVAWPTDDRQTTAIGNSVLMSDGNLAFVWGAVKGPLSIRPQQPNVSWYLSRQAPDGTAWLTRTIVSDVSRGMSRLTMGFPVLAVDHSNGPFHDRLYLVWPDLKDAYSRILFSYSSDRGGTWTQPRIVDEWFDRCLQCRAYDNLIPTLAVSSHGVVGLMWYDRRDSTDGVGFAPRIAVSFDGGDTFRPSTLVSEHPATFDGTAWQLGVGSSGGGHFAPQLRGGNIRIRVMPQHWPGDTASLLPGPNASFRAFWIDNRTGTWQIWTAPIAVTGEAIHNGARELAGLEDVTSNVAVLLGRRVIDRVTNLVTVEAQVLNTSTRSIRLPVFMKVLSLSSDFGPIQAVNTDAPKEGGTLWAFGGGDNREVIPSGGSSAMRTLVFRLRGEARMSASAIEKTQADVVKLELKVLGRLGT